MINAYFHSSYTVSELDRSLDFYTHVLGIENSRWQVSDQPYLASVTGIAGASLKIGFCTVEGDAILLELVEYVQPKGVRAATGFGIPGSPHLSWTVDNLPAAFERLQTASVKLLGSPQPLMDGLWGNYTGFFLEDPDGLLIELIEDPAEKGGTGRLTSLHHTGYIVSDLNKTLDLLIGLLEFELVTRKSFDSRYLRTFGKLQDNQMEAAYLRLPGTKHMLELWEFRRVSGKPADLSKNNTGSAHMCFQASDIHQAHADLSARGVQFVGKPVEITAGRNKGGYAIYFSGPDGIPFELFQKPPELTKE
jgi:catechol 2,3-dioxygenase-like lactoylglutathione lyase family enzyme